MSLHSSSIGLLAAASLAAVTLLAPRASAADLDPGYADIPAAMPQQMVTFGSGWYVRGDIAATDGINVNAGSIPYQGPIIGPGQSRPSLATTSTSHPSYDAGIGAGYQFTPYFRTDAVFDYDQPVSSSSRGQGRTCVTGNYLAGTQIVNNTTTPIYRNTYTTCTPTLTAKMSSYDVLLNGYFDLGTWYGVTPYVGAGVGASFGTATASARYVMANNEPYNITFNSAANGQTYKQNWNRMQSSNYTNFAYAFMAGFAYPIFAHTSLDIGYRYVNLGNVLGTKIATQQVHAGLRYMIDN